MPINFTFALSQQQTFELRCDYGSRRLNKTELVALIDLCEQNYYSQQKDSLPDLIQLGWRLYQWLDGNEGWLRRALNDADEQTIYLDLIQTSEAQGLNPETERVALGLAHLPWELLHNGGGFLLEREDISVLPVRRVQQRQTPVIGVQNRPLRLLFMATSPEDPRVPLLGFEQEEANILKATKDQPLALIVEESGSVAELANLVQSYPEDYFDVFHLTGHGIIYTQQGYGCLLPTGTKLPDNTPCFITEDEVGNMQLTTVNDLAKAFRGRWPRVTFLSGCHTGQVPNKGTVPSMAQALVKAGAGIVLGWARPVFDTTGIIAAQALYQALATGATVEEAVKAAQQEMIDEECTDWHLLRIYRDTRPINQLVTALRKRDRERLTFTAPEQEFLDENNLVKVASRFEFVGRRRPLQRCLKALGETSDQIGVFIAGMGGLGKSSLAARLCTRVQMQRDNFARVVLIGPLDEIGLLNKLSNKYERFVNVPALLNEPKVSLKGRLQNFFEAIEKQHKQPLLLVLDDFEQNIPTANIEDGLLRMTPKAYEILRAICAALADNRAESRLIVTCRYLKADTLPPHRLHLESLAAMSSSDIDKICFPLDKEVRQQLRTQRIIKIADGNPRLLKWLLEVIQQPGIAADELLNRLEATEQKFRENILAQTLLDALELEEQKFLARLSVFHLPVTEEIINVLMQNLSPTPLLQGEGLQSPPFPHREGGRGLAHTYPSLSVSA
ncbi:MAG: CHAT domain-containing protein [Nostoc sp.]|uniref:CHAT domain-containing protein n=1 Tax=Nostoc sp. TaxID=1180 RepID=UPI002FFABEA3